jgi:hypothetical protein
MAENMARPADRHFGSNAAKVDPLGDFASAQSFLTFSKSCHLLADYLFRATRIAADRCLGGNLIGDSPRAQWTNTADRAVIQISLEHPQNRFCPVILEPPPKVLQNLVNVGPLAFL